MFVFQSTIYSAAGAVGHDISYNKVFVGSVESRSMMLGIQRSRFKWTSQMAITGMGLPCIMALCTRFPRQQQRRQQSTPDYHQANGGLSTSAAGVTMATRAPRSNGIHTQLGGPELSKMQRPRSPLTLNQRSNTHTGHETPDARPSSAPGDNQKQDAGPGGFAHHRNPGQGSNGQPRRQQPKPLLLRTRSEFGVRPNDSDQSDEEIPQWGARHGFDELYESQQFMDKLANNWYMYWTDKRHESTGKPKASSHELQDWRMRDRLKTVSAALAVCLNISVEPPDQLRTNPGAKLEAWTDPYHPAPQKALENIGKQLQSQYETLAIRTRYKQYLDPSVEETKKFCVSLRRNAKDERVLLHYNGHGVPKPTASGEIWVFNKNYTQYIPVSLYDLQHWLQAPTIFVWDCSEAGNILNNYHRFVEKHEQEEDEQAARDSNYEKTAFQPYIHLAACGVKENLPTNPLLPADLFTACLTTPIEMALWFFVLQNPLKTNCTPEQAKKLPGRLQERRTPLGELNWIFTAITDTIAWTTLPRHLFRKFFRQDLMVAALFRNFLLAQRVMSVYGCHPQSFPELPDTKQHPLWASWDLAVDMALAQLPMLQKKENDGIDYEYQNSTFFTEQLTAFEVYLARGDAMSQKPPEQLPVVLQVLLSQQHRVRALILLGSFLDLGPWSVQLALSIGIFPYVLKLLQSAAAELKPVMVFIWTRILAVDISCQQDLIKDNGYNYFAAILKPTEALPVSNSDEHKAMCAFILAMLCRGYKPGQHVCNQTDIMTYCLAHLQHQDNPLLRQWACLCLSQLWNDLPEAKWRGIRENAPSQLSVLTKDRCPEVRAAMLHAMTTFIGIIDLTDEVARVEESIAWTLLDMANDGSPMVRREFLVFLSHFILRFESKFIVAAVEQLQEEKEYLLFPPEIDGLENKMGLHYTRQENRNVDGTIKPSAHGFAHNTVFAACWKHALMLNVDPHPEVQRDATTIVDYMHNALLASPVGEHAQALMDDIRRRAKRASARSQHAANNRHGVLGASPSSTNAPLPSPGLLRRTASYLFTGMFGANGAMEPGRTMNQSNPVPSSPGLPRSASQKFRGPELASAPPDQIDQTNYSKYHTANEPVSGGYEERSVGEISSLPLRSTFLDWSVEYFREPQMKPSESDEPGSTEYNERLWRRSRNETILQDTQPLKQYAGSHKWDNQVRLINNGAQPAKMTFHQFEDQLAVADNGNTVYVWDWKKQSRLSKFSNGNPEGSKISDMKFINEDDQGFLMTGSSDGVIRVYRNYDSDDAGRTSVVQESMVKKWKDDTDRQWIKSVHMQRGGQRELISASRNGKVKLWDIRMDKPLHTFQTTKDPRDTVRTASTHEHLPVFAVGTSARRVQVFNFDGQELSEMEPYSSFLQQNRGLPISATAFHPHRPILGTAARGDHHINLFTCENAEMLQPRSY
ncbi:WD repeat-containing protein mip1 [Verticillium alfalfae VaMs.102]|uniref:WD repeat-containing protein mip1 n=1 Tax=Verticillium alfalfae (strain VaMs.102 / ATCC MYA-4576 / FGSC 10136) TaxID=526221 RepID=C9SB89_VERA1|nr:WD repeat-containing protein mip1 [Verticillium alfalfae VaMs.102]EEY15639.1 WD repeat-containing protein mip1 [Verticillium alfalfae VaMs.102]